MSSLTLQIKCTYYILQKNFAEHLFPSFFPQSFRRLIRNKIKYIHQKCLCWPFSKELFFFSPPQISRDTKWTLKTPGELWSLQEKNVSIYCFQLYRGSRHETSDRETLPWNCSSWKENKNRSISVRWLAIYGMCGKLQGRLPLWEAKQGVLMKVNLL